MLAAIHNQQSGSLCRQKRPRRGNSHILILSVNTASTIFAVVSKLIGNRFARCYPLTMYGQPSQAKEKSTR